MKQGGNIAPFFFDGSLEASRRHMIGQRFKETETIPVCLCASFAETQAARKGRN
jgi:hypothetical protein